MNIYAIAQCSEGGFVVYNEGVGSTMDARRGSIPCFAGSLAECLDFLRKALEPTR